MIKRLVAFGCSWTYGDELEDPQLQLGDSIQGRQRDNLLKQYRLDHCFAGLTAEHYGLELENLAFPGASAESIRYTLQWWLDNNEHKQDALIIVGHTNASRQSWFNPQHVISESDPGWNRHLHGVWLQKPNPDIDNNWFELQKLWLGMSYHKDWAVHNYKQVLNAFDYVRIRWNIPVLQFNCLDNQLPASSPSLLYPGNSFRSILTEMDNNKKDLHCPGGHPNEKGHQIIANHLIEHIKHANILG